MHGFVLFLHFFGLMLGAAGTFGAFVIMRRAQKAPAAEAETLRKVGWPLAMVSGAGLVVLWITGIMMLIASGHAGNMPMVFTWKIVFVVVLTVLNGLTHRTYAQMRRTGNVALAQRLTIFGPVSAATLLLIVLLAAYAFN